MSQKKLHKLWCDFTWNVSTIIGLKAVIHYGVIAFYKGPSWNTKAVIIQWCLDEWSFRRAWYWNQWGLINRSSKTNGTLQLGVGRTGRNPCGAKIQRGSSSSPGRIYIGLAANICTLVAGVAAQQSHPAQGRSMGYGYLYRAPTRVRLFNVYCKNRFLHVHIIESSALWAFLYQKGIAKVSLLGQTRQKLQSWGENCTPVQGSICEGIC